MNNFFKLSVIAAAVALSGTATAGSFTGNDTVATANANAIYLSTQGLLAAGVSAVQYLPEVSYKLGADYLANDEITFTFVATFGTNTVFPTNITVGAATFQKTTVTTDAVTYRVVSGSAVAGSVFTFAQNKVSAADLTDTAKSGIVVANAQVGANMFVVLSKTAANVTFDADTSAATNADIFLVSTTQFGTSKVTEKFNAVIDGSLAGASKKFVFGTSDALTVAYTAPKVMPTQALLGQNIGLNDLTAAKVAPVMTVNVLGAGQLTAANFTFASAVVGTTFNTSVPDVITVTYPTGTVVPSDTLTITPKTGASAAVINAITSFDAIATANGATILAAGGIATENAGKWTVTGSETVNVPYMPYGTGLSQVIYATNKSASNVEVSVVATDEAGTVYDLGVVTTAKASSVTKLATEIKNGLAAQSFTSGKVSLAITFRGNADLVGSTIELHTGYNANASDRGFVANSSNGA
jgi:hypothetical protein